MADLKSLNLLVDDNWNIKLADFGISEIHSELAEQPSLLGSESIGTPGVCLRASVSAQG